MEATSADYIKLECGLMPNVMVALLNTGSALCSTPQSLRRWTEGATYVRQGDHHVGHWPTFLVTTHLQPRRLNR